MIVPQEDNIPISSIKPVAEHITSPVAHIVDIQISKQTFVKKWKRARISSILKMTKPESPADY